MRSCSRTTVRERRVRLRGADDRFVSSAVCERPGMADDRNRSSAPQSSEAATKQGATSSSRAPKVPRCCGTHAYRSALWRCHCLVRERHQRMAATTQPDGYIAQRRAGELEPWRLPVIRTAHVRNLPSRRPLEFFEPRFIEAVRAGSHKNILSPICFICLKHPILPQARRDTMEGTGAAWILSST